MLLFDSIKHFVEQVMVKNLLQPLQTIADAFNSTLVLVLFVIILCDGARREEVVISIKLMAREKGDNDGSREESGIEVANLGTVARG